MKNKIGKRKILDNSRMRAEHQVHCIITVKGDGAGKYGKPKLDKTGPLSEFLVDNSVFYLAVTKHLHTCKVCRIDTVLQEYLRRRIQMPKFHLMTSMGLVKRAIILETIADKKGETLTSGLVNEIIWRRGASAVIEYGHRLTLLEKYKALRLKEPGKPFDFPKLDGINQCLANLARVGLERDPSSEDELLELMKVADVMIS